MIWILFALASASGEGLEITPLVERIEVERVPLKRDVVWPTFEEPRRDSREVVIFAVDPREAEEHVVHLPQLEGVRVRTFSCPRLVCAEGTNACVEEPGVCVEVWK